MKAILISASPHKEASKTFILAKEVARGLAQEGIECESIHLADLRVSFCKHCEACHKKILNCSVSDDAMAVLRKMLEADGIIIASPNYINQISGLMKTLLDRSAHFIHCKRLLGKYVCGVVSSGSGMDKTVLDYIEFYAHTCGAQYSGGVSAVRQFGSEKLEEAFNLGKKLAADIKEQKAYPEQVDFISRAKRHFGRIIKARSADWQEEYQYWIDKGWL